MHLHRIVGTAGHIDHGKSALVKAFTGIDPDRLQEEKERGITIDLGFAHVDLDDELTVGFIDVPGHERFVKNMLAGIGGIDAMLLVVAADESIMPQTEEHFAICRLLGVSEGVVAITKCDLVEPEIAELVQLEVQEFLSGTELEGLPIVRTSVQTGEGLRELSTALASRIVSTPGRPAEDVLRLPIDRIFTVRGFGTVVTGTLLSGAVSTGDALDLHPAGERVTVRGVQVHGAAVGRAAAGQRTALNLHGVQREDLARGMLLATPGALAPTHLIDARLQLLDGFGELTHLQRVRFHHGAAEVLARVAVLEGETIQPGGSAFVQLRLERPYPVAPGDRFIVRRYSPMVTVGGGVVLDGQPPKHRRRSIELTERLRRLETSDDPGRLALWTAEAGLPGVGAAVESRLARSRAATADAARRAAAAGKLVIVSRSPLHLAPPAPFAALQEAIHRCLAAYHEEQPLRPSMPKEDVRSAVAQNVPAVVFEAAVDGLAATERIRIEADGLAIAGHSVSLTETQEQLRRTLLERFARAGLTPAAVGEVLNSLPMAKEAANEVYYHLLRRGELVRLRDQLTFQRQALEDLVDGLRARFSPGERFTVADFKDWAGVTRKHAIPLLEYLDSQRVTRRAGDVRVRI